MGARDVPQSTRPWVPPPALGRKKKRRARADARAGAQGGEAPRCVNLAASSALFALPRDEARAAVHTPVGVISPCAVGLPGDPVHPDAVWGAALAEG